MSIRDDDYINNQYIIKIHDSLFRNLAGSRENMSPKNEIEQKIISNSEYLNLKTLLSNGNRQNRSMNLSEEENFVIGSDFHHSFKGFSVKLNDRQVNLLLENQRNHKIPSTSSHERDRYDFSYEIFKDKLIKLIDPILFKNSEIDRVHTFAASDSHLKTNQNNNNGGGDYIIPWGITEINAQPCKDLASSKYSTMSIDADVYIIDTGVSEHEAFNLVESVSFVRRPSSAGNEGQEQQQKLHLHGHATHVAGIIGARPNNKTKLIGVAPGVRIHSIRVLDENGQGLMSWILEGIDFVINRKLQHPEQTVIVNLSLGYESKNNQPTLLDQAIDRASRLGIIFIIAAGNAGRDSVMTAPAHNLNAITVGSYDQDGEFSRFSNYGEKIDVIAPGESIYSTWLNNSFATLSGTSMAAPHITGVVALLSSKNKKLTHLEILSYINKYKTKLITHIFPVTHTEPHAFQFPNGMNAFAYSFTFPLTHITGKEY